MQLRFFWIFGFCLLYPAFAFAQLLEPTITITPSVGAGQRSVLNLTGCEDLEETLNFYSVTIDFSPEIPPANSTFFILLGEECETNQQCELVETGPISNLGATAVTVDFSMQNVLNASGSTACEGVDRQLELLIDVEDEKGNLLGTAKTKDEESVIIDTQKPLSPVNLSVSGIENGVDVSWSTNPLNAQGEQVLGLQEAGFNVLCRLTGSGNDFSECDSVLGAIFQSTIRELNGQILENGVEVDVTVVTIDPADNESDIDPAEIVSALPIDVLDFGENYNGVELGGCSIGTPSRSQTVPLFFFAFFGIALLTTRRFL